MSSLSVEHRYTPFRCPRSSKALGIAAGTFRSLATELGEDWAALRGDAGDDLAASRLSRYWDVQDALVEGVFDICAPALLGLI